MVGKEQKQQKSKKSIAAEIIYSEKATEIFNYIQKIKEKIKDTVSKGKEINSSKFLEFISRFSDEMDYITEELMRQDIRVATATGLIELRPYPVN
jgi:gas vesicle protein